jgi:hypothetical protein
VTGYCRRLAWFTDFGGEERGRRDVWGDGEGWARPFNYPSPVASFSIEVAENPEITHPGEVIRGLIVSSKLSSERPAEGKSGSNNLGTRALSAFPQNPGRRRGRPVSAETTRDLQISWPLHACVIAPKALPAPRFCPTAPGKHIRPGRGQRGRRASASGDGAVAWHRSRSARGLFLLEDAAGSRRGGTQFAASRWRFTADAR